MSEYDKDEAKRASRGFSADLSPEAVTRRLKILAELCETADYLSQFKPVPSIVQEEPGGYRVSPKEGGARRG